MDLLLEIPFSLRLLGLFVFGTVVGLGIDRWVIRLAIPFRESPRPHSHRRYILSPLFGVLFAGLYWWEIGRLGISLPPPNFQPESPEILHIRFAAHAILAFFLYAATIIDFDEMLIPDEITIPGTLLGLIFATIFPFSFLPAANCIGINERGYEVFSDHAVPIAWASPMSPTLPFAVFVIISIWWFWCFAMMNRLWYVKFGLKKAFLLLWRSLRRSRSTKLLIGLGVFGTIIISIFYFASGGADSPHWNGLQTSMLGLFGGAVVIWAVRLVGTAALGREAMGFGDVTLMALIGTYIGWQGCVLIFFLAPFAGLVLGIVRYALRAGNELPYGPFLCLGTLVLVLKWPFFYNFFEPFLILGPFVPLGMIVCMVLLGLMLAGWSFIRNLAARQPVPPQIKSSSSKDKPTEKKPRR